MNLIYLDEAGNTGSKADPDQPIHMIGALIVDEAHVRPIEVKLNALAERCAELSGNNGQPIPADSIEFHGAEIFGGKGLFRHIKPIDRIDVCKEIIKACSEEQAVFGYSAVNKMKLLGGHPHMRCFKFTLERLQDHLSRTGALGLLIADEHRELEEAIIQDLKFSRENSTGWGYRPTTIRSIVDTIHFVKSRHNRLVQACDVLTYFRLKGMRLTSRLLDAYRALNNEQGTTYPAYVAANTKPAEHAVLALEKVIASIERFQKLWPE